MRKHRGLLIGAGVLLVLAGWAYFSRRPAQAPAAETGAPERQLVGFDINTVARLSVTDGTQTAVVARTEGTWTIPGLRNYPANFDRVVEELKRLALLKDPQVMRGGTEHLAEFGLDPDQAADGRPLRVSFQDGDGALLGEFLVGKDRDSGTGRPGGGYARAGDGPVLLVPESLSRFSAVDKDWVDTVLLRVSSFDISSIEVQPGGGTAYRLGKNESGAYVAAGLKEDEEVQRTEADRLARALSYLSFTRLADPALSDEELGFDQPGVLRLKTKNNLVYEARVGKATDDGLRYARFAVNYIQPEPPAEPEAAPAAEPAGEDETPAPAPDEAAREQYLREQAEYDQQVTQYSEQAQKEQGKLAGWTFVIPASDAETMLLPRDNVITVKAPEPEEGDAGTAIPAPLSVATEPVMFSAPPAPAPPQP